MVLRKLIILLAPAAASLAMVSWVNRDLETRPFDYSAIPKTVDGFASSDMPVTDLVSEILLTDQILGRQYFGPGGAYFLSVVYYPNGKVNFHHPEGCTRAKGSLLLNRRPVPLSGAWTGTDGTYFQIKEPGGRTTHYLYAFCTPYQANGSYVEFRKHLALTSLRKGRTACALIRLSKTGNGTAEEEIAELSRFWARLSVDFRKGFGGGT